MRERESQSVGEKHQKPMHISRYSVDARFKVARGASERASDEAKTKI